MDPKGIDPARIALGRPRSLWPLALLILPAIAFPILLGILAWRDDGPAWFLLSVAVAVAFAWLAYRFFRSQEWGYVPFIKLHDGSITFTPSPNSYDTLAVHRAAFPPGARLEYRVETGDMYFDGDRGQALARSLWVVEPDGIKKLLVRDFLLLVDFSLAAQNLKSVGIPFQVTRVYDGEKGDHVETDITPTIARPPRWLPVGILVGTSSLWLGALAGFFIHDIWTVSALGTAAFTILAIATICSNPSKRTALLKLVATLPSYAGGYAFAVVCVRQFVGR